jgi:hypothetical protein
MTPEHLQQIEAVVDGKPVPNAFYKFDGGRFGMTAFLVYGELVWDHNGEEGYRGEFFPIGQRRRSYIGCLSETEHIGKFYFPSPHEAAKSFIEQDKTRKRRAEREIEQIDLRLQAISEAVAEALEWESGCEETQKP